jgi:hypothetical protein
MYLASFVLTNLGLVGGINTDSKRPDYYGRTVKKGQRTTQIFETKKKIL